jgi:LacI family transcriptional regulator
VTDSPDISDDWDIDAMSEHAAPGGIPRQRPTMRDVAALSGVSIKTVSRVVNNEPGVSSDLIGRVNEAARKLDYQRDLTASALRRSDGKSQTLGLLLENVANPFSSALHRAIEDEVHKRGLTVFAGSVDEDPARERELVTAFIARRVDGLIIVPTGDDQSYLGRELRNGTPTVFVDRAPALLDADSVVTDNLAGARDALHHLISHGHRRIAYLGDLRTIVTAGERLAGYRAAHEDAGILVDPSIVVQDLRTSERADVAVTQLMAHSTPPTALFSGQNLVTIGAVRALRRLGLHRDVAVVGFDDIPLAELLDPALTLVAQDVVGLGSTAARLLFERLEGRAGPTQHVVLPPTLTVRGSGEISGPHRP